MNTAQNTKALAQKIARQMAREPLEILKSAREQVSGSKIPPQEEIQNETKVENGQSELQEKMKSLRRMEAYQRELSDIKREKLFGELQRRITQGEEIPLQDYPELSMEQKQVLNAQMEAVRNRSMRQGTEAPLVEPAAKKGRRLFNFGKKQEVKRQQTRVENIVPPSG